MTKKFLSSREAKATLWPACVGFFVLFLIIVVCLYQFGPPGIHRGDDRILANALCSDGSRIVILAHRTFDLIDAYEVSLYKITPKQEVYICFLGHQEAYWWGCSLQPSVKAGDFQVRAFGTILGVYSPSDGLMVWSGKEQKTYASYKIDGINVVHPIPELIASRIGSNHSKVE